MVLNYLVELKETSRDSSLINVLSRDRLQLELNDKEKELASLKEKGRDSQEFLNVQSEVGYMKFMAKNPNVQM